MKIGTLLIMIMLAVLAARPAAGDVSFEVSSREAYVGSSIEFRAIVRGGDENDPAPANPGVRNGKVVGGPFARQMGTEITINGRPIRSDYGVTYTWKIRPATTGRMVITPPVVSAKGRKIGGDPIVVVVLESDAGDLAFADIEVAREEVFLGEPLELRLRIWIKAYRDRRVRLTERQMWTRVDAEETDWSIFLPRIQELANNRQRPLGKEVPLDGDDGRSYYRYELPMKVWPDRAGPFDPGRIEIVVKYPLKIERTVFRDMRVTRERPVIVAPEIPEIVVKTPPEAGRPTWFNGAVGRFDFDVTARPTEVAVGDPVTITMNVRDLTRGRAQLELLQPPPLARVPELTEDFRMPSDPLAGEVTGGSKRFSQTLRARTDLVERIPRIPFAYFDPETEQYVTLHSKPIPLTVSPAATVSMTDVIGGTNGNATPTELTEVNAGLLANAEVDALLASASTRPPAWWLLVLAAPPLAFALTAVTQRRVHRTRHDRGWVRQRRARREAMRCLRMAGEEQARLVGDAISGYVADRCNLPAGAVTKANVVKTLRAGNVADELVAEVEELLAEGEASRFAGADTGGRSDMVGRARSVINKLERERLA